MHLSAAQTSSRRASGHSPARHPESLRYAATVLARLSLPTTPCPVRKSQTLTLPSRDNEPGEGGGRWARTGVEGRQSDGLKAEGTAPYPLPCPSSFSISVADSVIRELVSAGLVIFASCWFVLFLLLGSRFCWFNVDRIP